MKPQGHREITCPNLVAPQFCIFYSWETRRLRPHLIVPPWESSPENKTKADLCQQREPFLKYFTHTYYLCCVLSWAVLRCVQLFWPHGLQPARLLCPWGFSRQEWWSGLLQGFFQTQGSNPGLPHWKRILYHLNHREVQEYWSGQPRSPRELANPGVKLGSPALQVDTTSWATRGAHVLPRESVQLWVQSQILVNKNWTKHITCCGQGYTLLCWICKHLRLD